VWLWGRLIPLGLHSSIPAFLIIYFNFLKILPAATGFAPNVPILGDFGCRHRTLVAVQPEKSYKNPREKSSRERYIKSQAGQRQIHSALIGWSHSPHSVGLTLPEARL
jgi:hypothetical protein